MEIILVSKHETGQAALHAKRIGGHLAPERQYHIINHKLTLSGHPDKVLKSDAQELLNMPNGLYRMPTPAEQEQWRREEQEANQIQESEQGEEAVWKTGSLPTESVPQESVENEEEPGQDNESDKDEEPEDDTDEQEPTTPPAMQEKPKRQYHRKKH